MPDSKWSLAAYIDHSNTVLRLESKFQEERDRRYAEVAVEREKALRIKETADLAALELARESQVYKDERNDAMREQSLSQTGAFATHSDLSMVAEKMESSINLVAERMETALKPLVSFMQTNQGENKQRRLTAGQIYAAIAAVTSIIVAAFYIFKA